MTDKEKLKAIEDAIGSPLDNDYCFDEIIRVLEAQPDPHPLGSVPCMQATDDEWREFWEAHGFICLDWEGWVKPLKKPSGVDRYLGIERRMDGVTYRFWARREGAPLPGNPATLGEALDAVNELSATKIMGGWA